MTTTVNALTQIYSGRTTPTPRSKRSLADLLAPLERLAQTSPSLIAEPGGTFEIRGQAYELPRYVFPGAHCGDEPIRIGLFAAIHGDEPEGAYALVQLIGLPLQNPELAAGYCLIVYPVCNPTGFEDHTRCSRRGRDLNREFWNNFDL